MHLDIQNVLERAIVGDAGLRVFADLPGENDIPRRYRYPVTPEGIAAQGEAGAHTLFAGWLAGLIDDIEGLGTAIVEGRKFGAELAHRFPVMAEDRNLSPGHRQDVGLDQHRVDDRVQG